MASDGQTWQDGMSLVECNKYMLSNSVSTDVTFIVGENRKQVLAHKYVLGSRSSVFYAMLFGPMAESGATITISDIEPDIFQEILRYLYYEEVLITMGNVTSLLFAADKYNIISVMKKCVEYLSSNVAMETVCTVLNIAVTLQNEELKNKCLDFVFKSPKTVLQSSSIWELHRESLKLINQADELQVSETLVYESVKRWAESQCRSNNIEVCDSNLREMIGDMKSLIRFTIMDKDDFAKIVSICNILTLQEKVQVFQLHRGVNIKEEDIFCGTDLRIMGEHVCMNVSIVEKEEENFVSDNVRFSISEKAQIIGFALCTSNSQNTYDIEAGLYQNETLLASVSTKYHTTEGESSFRVKFQSGVYIEPNIWYTAQVTICGPVTVSCYRLGDSCTEENVTFNFETQHLQHLPNYYKDKESWAYSEHNHSSTYIPGIVFRKI